MNAFSTGFQVNSSRAVSRAGTEYLCWSRMQAEAGQDLERIVHRKELERVACNGLFFWGVGNAPSTAISALARLQTFIPVVFSIMKGRPKAVDVSPTAIVAWRCYIDADGTERELPAGAVVTSRRDSARGAKRAHYALMCLSAKPLRIERGEPFDVAAYRNASGTGAPVGASQVTALLKRVAGPTPAAAYEVNLKAKLAGGYWVRLTDPVEVPIPQSERLANAGSLGATGWASLASDIRYGKPAVSARKNLLLV